MAGSVFFKEPAWTTVEGLGLKLTGLMNLKAKAVLVVMDPKSGSESLADEDPGMAEYLSSSMFLKFNDPQEQFFPGSTRIIIIDRDVAEAILNGSGFSLEELQKGIDMNLKPQSFLIKAKTIRISSDVTTEDKVLKNVAGYVEGRDARLKNEVVVYSAHSDHLGLSGRWQVICRS